MLKSRPPIFLMFLLAAPHLCGDKPDPPAPAFLTLRANPDQTPTPYSNNLLAFTDAPSPDPKLFPPRVYYNVHYPQTVDNPFLLFSMLHSYDPYAGYGVQGYHFMNQPAGQHPYVYPYSQFNPFFGWQNPYLINSQAQYSAPYWSALGQQVMPKQAKVEWPPGDGLEGTAKGDVASVEQGVNHAIENAGGSEGNVEHVNNQHIAEPSLDNSGEVGNAENVEQATKKRRTNI